MRVRYSERVPVGGSVIFAGDNAIGEGRLLDLSLPGCLLESPEQMRWGEYVQLRLFLPDRLASVQVALAAVRWTKGSRSGIEFIRTSHEDERRLEQFVRRRLNGSGRPVECEGTAAPDGVGMK